MNLLSMANESSVPAADDFMPVLIYVLIKSGTTNLLSNVQVHIVGLVCTNWYQFRIFQSVSHCVFELQYLGVSFRDTQRRRSTQLIP